MSDFKIRKRTDKERADYLAEQVVVIMAKLAKAEAERDEANHCLDHAVRREVVLQDLLIRADAMMEAMMPGVAKIPFGPIAELNDVFIEISIIKRARKERDG